MSKLLLNCDLGEWETPDLTRQLMQTIDLANIACGGHAGDETSIRRCLELAEEFGVHAGAHPGTANGGRENAEELTIDSFRETVSRQIDTFLDNGALIHHVKLHGSLYHLSETNPAIRDTYLEIAIKLQIPVICLAGGKVEAQARSSNIPFFAEAFLDRGYQSNSSLVPRGQPGDLITDPDTITTRLRSLASGTQILSIDGTPIAINATTACVHSDSPNSVEIAKSARSILDER